jgi:hypothetical protein
MFCCGGGQTAWRFGVACMDGYLAPAVCERVRMAFTVDIKVFLLLFCFDLLDWRGIFSFAGGFAAH